MKARWRRTFSVLLPSLYMYIFIFTFVCVCVRACVLVPFCTLPSNCWTNYSRTEKYTTTRYDPPRATSTPDISSRVPWPSYNPQPPFHLLSLFLSSFCSFLSVFISRNTLKILLNFRTGVTFFRTLVNFAFFVGCNTVYRTFTCSVYSSRVIPAFSPVNLKKCACVPVWYFFAFVSLHDWRNENRTRIEFSFNIAQFFRDGNYSVFFLPLRFPMLGFSGKIQRCWKFQLFLSLSWSTGYCLVACASTRTIEYLIKYEPSLERSLLKFLANFLLILLLICVATGKIALPMTEETFWPVTLSLLTRENSAIRRDHNWSYFRTVS